jgi:hypothetical protein
MNRSGLFIVKRHGGYSFLKTVNRQKNNDRIAVNLRHGVASFWIDVRDQEVKATRTGAVASMGNGTNRPPLASDD